jgi:hypothetical protein
MGSTGRLVALPVCLGQGNPGKHPLSCEWQWTSRGTRKSTTGSNIFQGARQVERLSATSSKPLRPGATASFTGASRLQMRAESSGRWSREQPRSPTCITTNDGLSHHRQLSSGRLVALPVKFGLVPKRSAPEADSTPVRKILVAPRPMRIPSFEWSLVGTNHDGLRPRNETAEAEAARRF